MVDVLSLYRGIRNGLKFAPQLSHTTLSGKKREVLSLVCVARHSERRGLCVCGGAGAVLADIQSTKDIGILDTTVDMRAYSYGSSRRTACCIPNRGSP